MILVLFLPITVSAKGIYQTNEDFLNSIFNKDIPKVKAIWQKGLIKKEIKNILGHRYPSLRIKYWANENRSVWILDEIGKDKQITVGVVVSNGKIEKIRILEFRESRGDEVRFTYFTNQFNLIGLTPEKKLTHSIDAITGATLSVRAIKKIAKLALFLDQHQLSLST